MGGKHVHLGCHEGEVAAAQAFDQAAMLRHAHRLGPQSSSHSDAALVTNFTPAFYQVGDLPVETSAAAASHAERMRWHGAACDQYDD